MRFVFILQTGVIVHTGDFKFDQAAGKLYKPEIGKMVKIGEEGVLCLLSDSTDAEKPGYTKSEAVVAREILMHFIMQKDGLLLLVLLLI